MKKIKFFPFYLLSILPIQLLFILSDITYIVIYKCIKYRKDVVSENLKKAFPEKSKQELLNIEKKFYKHFCDLMFESIKTLTINEKSIQKRFQLQNTELIDDLYAQNKSVLLYAAHLGNWEWQAFFPKYLSGHQVTAFYQPLSNKYFDELMQIIRGRMGVLCIPSQKGYKTMMKMKADKKLTFNLMIGDQCPAWNSAKYWTEFLHQKTAFLLGADAISKKSDCAVVYPKCTKIKRGVYKTEFILLDSSPKNAKTFSIVEKYSKVLEQNIKLQPDLWLWSHKRWKLTA
ncbi:lysophospholipid acyltransferase family protein [Flammeovirga aprica]|uniref:Lipid A biosynthesis acyltransferase n=1 Tax=Flammeovirga aprica JL-4 TaxID=694437 RepID=A0A7X9RVZ4_9BACT|nr:lysophospholipid acyltransferase family protein [Flammeovirga aprica]NME69709.1 lipid A biosynthesis acyltransferase [Flammeovirga aprica JL-4]